MDEQFLIKLADNVPAVLAFWDKNGLCRYANKQYRKWYHVEPEQLIGKHISQVLGPMYALSKPHIDNALEGETQRFLREIPDPDGGPPRVNQVVLVPHVEGGEVVGFFALATEVSDGQAQYQAALDAAPGAMLGVDERGTIMLKNVEAARVFGYSSTELLGMKISALVPELRSVPELFVAGPPFEAHSSLQPEILWGRRKDASEFPIELSLHRQHSESGTFTLCSISDRSAEVENVRIAREKAELTRINRDVEAFASIASHDLKAPLRAIQNAVYWLEQVYPASYSRAVFKGRCAFCGRAHTGWIFWSTVCSTTPELVRRWCRQRRCPCAARSSTRCCCSGTGLGTSPGSRATTST